MLYQLYLPKFSFFVLQGFAIPSCRPWLCGIYSPCRQWTFACIDAEDVKVKRFISKKVQESTLKVIRTFWRMDVFICSNLSSQSLLVILVFHDFCRFSRFPFPLVSRGRWWAHHFGAAKVKSSRGGGKRELKFGWIWSRKWDENGKSSMEHGKERTQKSTHVSTPPLPQHL